MDRFTRRRFVRHGATLAGAASATALLGGTPLGRAIAASATGALSQARRKTYAAVVEAVALAKQSGVSAANLDATTARFEALYRRGEPGFRSAVENVLDHVEQGAGGEGFSALSPRQRLAVLREWNKAERGTVRGMSSGTLASTASMYAVMPFRRDPIEDPRTLAVHI